MVVVAFGNLVRVLRQAKRLRRLPTDFKVGGVHHEVAEVIDASRFEKGLIAVLALQANKFERSRNIALNIVNGASP